MDLPAGRSSSGAADASLFLEAAPATPASERRRERSESCARGCRAGAPKVMAEEAKAAADTPPPPPDKEDGEVAEANAAPQATAEGPHPLEHKWTFAAV